MIYDSEDKNKKELRKQTRTLSQGKDSVEFLPGKSNIAYLFKLRDFSSQGFGIIVRKDSSLLELIKPGDILHMKYYALADTSSPEIHRTQIKHISEFESGKYEGHMLVGLLILE